jgi:N-acetylmuramate 1-kinase
MSFNDPILEMLLKDVLNPIRGFETGVEIVKLKGDASYRSYYRLRPGAGVKDKAFESLILMQWDPAMTAKSEEASKRTSITELPFLNLQRYLSSGGIRVPAIVADAVSNGMLLLEDLGDQTLEREIAGRSPAEMLMSYKKAIDDLVEMQILGDRVRDPGCLAFHRAFDNGLYMWEFDHFVEYLIEARNNSTVPENDRVVMTRHFQQISGELDSIKKGFTHRDYQSRNLMVKNGRLYVIDFQDALMGPPQYDLVALLKDSYVDIPEYYTKELVEYYLKRREENGSRLDHDAFWRGFRLQTIQRKLKDAGRFVFIDRVKNNPSFLPHIPQSLEYVWRYLSSTPELADLCELLKRYVPEFQQG